MGSAGCGPQRRRDNNDNNTFTISLNHVISHCSAALHFSLINRIARLPPASPRLLCWTSVVSPSVRDPAHAHRETGKVPG